MKGKKEAPVGERFRQALLDCLLNYGPRTFIIYDAHGREITGDAAEGWVLYPDLEQVDILGRYLDNKGWGFLKDISPLLESRHRKRIGSRRPLFIRQDKQSPKKQTSAFRLRRDEATYKAVLLRYIEEGRAKTFYASAYHRRHPLRARVYATYGALMQHSPAGEDGERWRHLYSLLRRDHRDLSQLRPSELTPEEREELQALREFNHEALIRQGFPESFRAYLRDEQGLLASLERARAAGQERGFTLAEIDAALSLSEQRLDAGEESLDRFFHALDTLRFVILQRPKTNRRRK